MTRLRSRSAWLLAAVAAWGCGAAAERSVGTAPPSAAPGEPGAGAATPAERPAAPGRELRDAELGFRLVHPPSFVVRRRSAAELAQWRPEPVAALYVMNPTMAAGALAGQEPADLEVRVHAAAADTTLEAWLRAAGVLVPDGPAPRPFPGGPGGGVEVCAATLMAPGCSVFFLHAGRIYQLTPATVEGEAMIRTLGWLGDEEHPARAGS